MTAMMESAERAFKTVINMFKYLMENKNIMEKKIPKKEQNETF